MSKRDLKLAQSFRGKFMSWVCPAIDLLCPLFCLHCGASLNRKSTLLCSHCIPLLEAAIKDEPRPICEENSDDEGCSNEEVVLFKEEESPGISVVRGLKGSRSCQCIETLASLTAIKLVQKDLSFSHVRNAQEDDRLDPLIRVLDTFGDPHSTNLLVIQYNSTDDSAEKRGQLQCEETKGRKIIFCSLCPSHI